MGLVLLVAVNIVVFTLMAQRPAGQEPYVVRPQAAATEEPADTPSPTPVAAPAPAQPVTPPVLAVYGDGYATGNELGGLGEAGWPALVAKGIGAQLVLSAVPRAGYAAVGATGETFVDLARAKPVPQAAVTLVLGTRNDAGHDAQVVQSRVTEVIGIIRAAAPTTVIVIVGPVWSDGNVPASVLGVRDAVQSAAIGAGLTFVDPLAEGWFAGRPELIAADGVSPNDDGHAYMAELLTPVLGRHVSAARTAAD